MGKVKVSKKVAEAYERLLSQHDKEKIMDVYLGLSIGPTQDMHTLRSLDFEDVLQMMANGYEVKKSPEEEIKEIYDTGYIDLGGLDDVQLNAWDAKILIKKILDLLDKKIEGINI